MPLGRLVTNNVQFSQHCLLLFNGCCRELSDRNIRFMKDKVEVSEQFTEVRAASVNSTGIEKTKAGLPENLSRSLCKVA